MKFVLGGGRLGLNAAKKCGAVHVDIYGEVNPKEVEGGVQIAVQQKDQALMFLNAAETVYIYLDFAELLPRISAPVVMVAPPSDPLCARHKCVDKPCS